MYGYGYGYEEDTNFCLQRYRPINGRLKTIFVGGSVPMGKELTTALK